MVLTPKCIGGEEKWAVSIYYSHLYDVLQNLHRVLNSVVFHSIINIFLLNWVTACWPWVLLCCLAKALLSLFCSNYIFCILCNILSLISYWMVLKKNRSSFGPCISPIVLLLDVLFELRQVFPFLGEMGTNVLFQVPSKYGFDSVFLISIENSKEAIYV